MLRFSDERELECGQCAIMERGEQHGGKRLVQLKLKKKNAFIKWLWCTSTFSLHDCVLTPNKISSFFVEISIVTEYFISDASEFLLNSQLGRYIPWRVLTTGTVCTTGAWTRGAWTSGVWTSGARWVCTICLKRKYFIGISIISLWKSVNFEF